ncbi:molybdopterin molybdotransferase MoeA [Polaribacter marinaquae]|uniref:Molybdopterin molybdenumtransferase n=1 Tax=Polaribacter marinaquae TaxID=1642819 RepID=A0ABZ2TN90_9FLAO
MILVKDAKDIILNSAYNFGVEEVPFLKSVGRILKENILADRDFPPFNRVSMDGICIDFNAFKNGQGDFKVEGIQAAGIEQMTLQNKENCIEVMTGAVLPNNANTVIRYEDVTLKNGIATININKINDCQNVHAKGKDRKVDDVLISENKIISAAEIGVLATVGKSTVKVAKQPKVMIVSTGDELVGVNEIPLKHQIRRSNVFTLVSLLERLKISSDTAHITDDKPILKQKIKGFLKDYDVLLFSGAVSKGKYDFLPEVFEELGIEKLFHKVAQRPGKPFFYGKTNECNIFGFPGNPISTFVNCLAYFYPWYYKSTGLETEEETAILGENVSFKPNLEFFLQVKLKSKFGHLVAFPVKGNGSGDLASLVNADAFIQLPNDKTEFKTGENYPIIRYR